jgi:hypothetical protein
MAYGSNSRCQSETDAATSAGSGTAACAPRYLWPTLASAAVVIVTAMQLHMQGRRWWCACGQWFLCSGDAWGPHNSQHLLDPYSLTHVLHGLLLAGLLALATPRLERRWRLVLSVCFECAWEIFENLAFIIARYRAETASLGYLGDSVANSLGDILSAAVGFWLATQLGWRKALALFVTVELVLLYWIRDSLLLNVVMLIYPLDTVRVWQIGG